MLHDRHSGRACSGLSVRHAVLWTVPVGVLLRACYMAGYTKAIERRVFEQSVARQKERALPPQKSKRTNSIYRNLCGFAARGWRAWSLRVSATVC